MQNKYSILGISLLLIGISACTQTPVQVEAPTQPPTPNLDAVRTEAAATVIAEFTSQAFLMSTPTFTSTPAPTSTSQVILATQPLLSVTLPPPPTLKSVPFVPTLTKNPYNDSAVLDNQSPSDGMILSPGEDVNITWVVRNTGMRAWSPEFYFKPAGNLPPVPSGIRSIDRTIEPGDSFEFSSMIEGPEDDGIYVLRYIFYNDDGFPFYQINFAIQVGG